MGHLSNVIAGSGFSQQIIGFVDDFEGVYDLGSRLIGFVNSSAENMEHVVHFASGGIVGYVGATSEAVNGGYWHKVYDASHQFVGLVDNGAEIESPAGQTLGTVVYNEGNGGTGWRRAGAALLLLLHLRNS